MLHNIDYKIEDKEESKEKNHYSITNYKFNKVSLKEASNQILIFSNLVNIQVNKSTNNIINK